MRNRTWALPVAEVVHTIMVPLIAGTHPRALAESQMPERTVKGNVCTDTMGQTAGVEALDKGSPDPYKAQRERAIPATTPRRTLDVYRIRGELGL